MIAKETLSQTNNKPPQNTGAVFLCDKFVMFELKFPTFMIYRPYLLRRFIAGFVDYLLIYGFSYLFALNFGESNGNGSYSLNGIVGLVPILVWVVMTVVLEQTAGATLGNGIAGLRPLDVSGKYKPHLFQSLKRHLLDPIDMFFFGVVAIVAIKNSPKHQRLGDQWAKTIVVKA